MMIVVLTRKPKGLRFNAEMSRHLKNVVKVQRLSFQFKNGKLILRPDYVGSKLLTNGNRNTPVCHICCAEMFDKAEKLGWEVGAITIQATWNAHMKAYVLEIAEPQAQAQ